jgi:hypothetical protein
MIRQSESLRPELSDWCARDDPLALERVEERDHRGAVDAQHGRGFLL